MNRIPTQEDNLKKNGGGIFLSITKYRATKRTKLESLNDESSRKLMNGIILNILLIMSATVISLTAVYYVISFFIQSANSIRM